MGELLTMLDRAADGELDDVLRDEITLLRAENRRLKDYVKDLERAADTDPLIPVFNRRAFMRELTRAQSVMERYDIPASLVFFDLNKFKGINDRYGHALGDELLSRIGRALQNGVRDCDMVARIGGDEFGVLLFKTTQKEAAQKAAALALRVANIKIEMPTEDLQVTVSWGITTCEPRISPAALLARADKNMYTSKKASHRLS